MGPTTSVSSSSNDDGSTTITIKIKGGSWGGDSARSESTGGGEGETRASSTSSAQSAARLRYPNPVNSENPHAIALKKAHARALAAYTRLWQDYQRPRWDWYRYVVNLITYTRIYQVYYSMLQRYHRWEEENQRSFSGRVVFYPPGAVPPSISPDPLAATATTTSTSGDMAAAPDSAAFPSTSSVTDTGKGSGTASSDDWTKGGKDSVDKIGPTSVPFTGNETVVTSTAASSTANTSPSSLTLDPSQPVAGAKVEISLDINYIRDPGPGGYPHFETTTDPRGAFKFKSLQQGVWTYTVTAPGFAAKTGTFEVKDGKIYQDIVLEKESRHPVAGNVFTVQAVFLSESLRNLIRESDAIDAALHRQIESHLNGGEGRSYPLYLRPVRNQDVTVTRTDPVIAIYPPPPAEIQTTKTDSSGAFRFTELKGDRYRLDVVRDGYKPYSVDVSTSEKSEDLRIILIEEDPDLGDTPLITE